MRLSLAAFYWCQFSRRTTQTSKMTTSGGPCHHHDGTKHQLIIPSLDLTMNRRNDSELPNIMIAKFKSFWEIVTASNDDNLHRCARRWRNPLLGKMLSRKIMTHDITFPRFLVNALSYEICRCGCLPQQTQCGVSFRLAHTVMLKDTSAEQMLAVMWLESWPSSWRTLSLISLQLYSSTVVPAASASQLGMTCRLISDSFLLFELLLLSQIKPQRADGADGLNCVQGWSITSNLKKTFFSFAWKCSNP